MIDCSRLALTVFTLIGLNFIFSGRYRIKWNAPDWLIAAHIFIIAFSSVYHSGFGEGLETAIATIVDMGMAYFVARVYLRNSESLRYFVRIAIIVAAISTLFAVAESFTGHSILRTFYHAFFPKVTHLQLVDQRLSLYRAMAAFRHHILFGMYCVTCFALGIYLKPSDLSMSRGVYRICMALCVLGVFTSLSSGPWLGLSLCVFCLVYSRLTRNLRGRWKLLIIGAAAVWVMLDIASNQGVIKLVINYLSIGGTGWIRWAMWESVLALVPQYWPLGYGWGTDWPRPDWYRWSSIDSFYAVTFVRSGIFAIASFIGFFAICWRRMSLHIAASGRQTTGETKGWILATATLALMAITVDIFGNFTFFTYMLFGAGQALLNEQRSVGIETVRARRIRERAKPTFSLQNP